MRWPWSSRSKIFLVEELDVPEDDPGAAGAAVERARRAVAKAQTNGDAMHSIAKAINRERQANHFSSALFASMRRKES